MARWPPLAWALRLGCLVACVDGVLWPQPRDAINGTAAILVSTAFAFRDLSKSRTGTIMEAIARYKVRCGVLGPGPCVDAQLQYS